MPKTYTESYLSAVEEEQACLLLELDCPNTPALTTEIKWAYDVLLSVPVRSGYLVHSGYLVN